MCDDPDCGRCNSQARERLVDTGIKLGDKILDILGESLTENNIDPTNKNDAYFFIETGQIALIKAAVALIVSVPSKKEQDLTLDNLVNNLTTMVRSMQERKSGPSDSAETFGVTLH